VVGNPGKIIKQVTDEMMAWKTEGTEIYQNLPKIMLEESGLVEPLRKVPANLQQQPKSYEPLKRRKSK
jgi:phenylacetic acid degradation protein